VFAILLLVTCELIVYTFRRNEYTPSYSLVYIVV